MAVPSGKRIGTTSVRVIPDATKFRNDLKLLLKRVESSMSANLEVVADTARFEADMRKLIKKWNGQNVNLDVDASTLGASAHLKEFTRPRTVPIFVKVSKASLAKAGTLLASLSGGRLVGDIVKNVSENLQNLDRALPKLALVSQGVGAIGAAGLNAVRGAGAVLIQLTQLLPLAALLPGVLVGAGLGVTALVVALKDAPARLGAAATAYKALGTVISNNFWAEAAKPIRSLLTDLLPQVKTGFKDLASELGSTIGGIATTFRDSFAGGALTSVFSDVADGLRNAAPGLNSFTSSFVSLIGFGAQYLPIFGSFVTKIGAQFNTWLSGLEASGQLNADISTAITLLGNLGGILGSVGSILTGVFNAGSGGNPIGGLATGLATVASIINSPGFQTALSTIFSGAALGASGLAAALGPIGSLIGKLAPTLSGILSSSGIVVGKILGDIAKALSQPAFETGLSDFFSGIEKGLLAIAPSLPAVAKALGQFGTFAGQLAAQIGPVLGTALSTLAPLFVDLLKGIAPILPILGTALISAIQQLAPLLPGLVAAIVPLLPVLAQIVADTLPMLVADLQLLLPVIEPLITYGLLPLLQGLEWLFAQGDKAVQFFEELISGVSPAKLALEELQGKFGPIIQGLAAVGATIGSIWGDATHAFVGFINMMIGALDTLIDGWNGFASALKKLSGGTVNLTLGKIPPIPTSTTADRLQLPRAATGMRVAGSPDGRPVMVGDGGRDEDIVDHGNMNTLINAVLNGQIRGGLGGPTVHVEQNIHPAAGQDERLIARAAGREFVLAWAGSI